MFQPQLLLDKRNEINEVFADFGDLDVRISVSGEAGDFNEDSDVDVLENLDKATDGDQDIVVCIRKLSGFVRHPFGAGAVRPQDSFGLSMYLMLKLQGPLPEVQRCADARINSHGTDKQNRCSLLFPF
jgi:hypothetical protein